MQDNEGDAEAKIDQIQAFLALSEQVGTAGQPTAEQFADIQVAGYQRVVNLALINSTDAIPEESEIVAKLGMDYVHIPVDWEEPTLADLSRFFAVMDDLAVTKVFVHCAKNMRVSVFMYLYRVIRQQTSTEKAGEDLHRIWIPIPPWQAFIDRAIAQFASSQNI
jgi:protein tyrosine phosphatase (PTP) superfamily phosphohydrolase (DUF442 family)